MLLARSTFLLLVVWALPALANQCYDGYYTCNRSDIAQSDPQRCTDQYHSCLQAVEAKARQEQEQAFRSSRSGGHGGGYANVETETASPAPQPRAAMNTRPQNYSDVPLSPSPVVRREEADPSRCPQSAYPYQGTSGVTCTTGGDIARQNLAAARGQVENEMMGFFAEISQTAPGER